ncbi:MAG: site-specific DNA-methyltransferase, partial [Sideroxydans sp.]|nr:site-specific DNA-methyltransferase [Sideroxydans sp.]
LEVLKHLMGAYSEQVKMIYIDPPYNTGSDGFVYQDDRKFSVEQLSNLAGIDEDEARRILTFTSSSSNSHSAWLTFMYPRLYLAKQLLKGDGVIFISIDNNEQAQLKVLCDEVFGEENFIETFSWVRTSTPAGLDAKSRKTNEYILCYEKVRSSQKYNGEQLSGDDQPLLNAGNSKGVLVFPIGTVKFNQRYFSDGDYKPLSGDRVEVVHEFSLRNGFNSTPFSLEGEFKWQQSFLDKEIEKGTTFVMKTDKLSIRFLRQEEGGFKRPNNFIADKFLSPLINKKENNVATNEGGSDELKMLFGKAIFGNPKPASLIKYLISFIDDKTPIILDFFAGSGTTAHAVMQLNAEDGGNRQFICVQIDEATDPKSEAYKAGYKTIFDITQARISKAAMKIKTEYPDCKADMGFKIFATQPMFDKYLDTPESLTENLELFDVKTLNQSDRHSLMLTWALRDGIKLGAPLTPVILGGYTAYAAEKILYFVEPDISLNAVVALLEQLDNNPAFSPSRLVVSGYLLDSKTQREMSEAVKGYNNRKGIELTLDIRYN